jgi:hypothetical protein
MNRPQDPSSLLLTPEERVRDADEVQTYANDETERGVDAELRQKIATEPARGIVHRDGGSVQII